MKDLRVIIYLLSHEVQSALHRVGHLDFAVSIIDLHASSTEEEDDKHGDKSNFIFNYVFVSVSSKSRKTLSQSGKFSSVTERERLVNIKSQSVWQRTKYWETAVRRWCLHRKAVQVVQSDEIQLHKGNKERNEACMTS